MYDFRLWMVQRRPLSEGEILSFGNGVPGFTFTDQNFHYLFDQSPSHPFNQRALDWFTEQFIDKLNNGDWYAPLRLDDQVKTFMYVRETIEGQMAGYKTAYKTALGIISAEKASITRERNAERSRRQNVGCYFLKPIRQYPYMIFISS